MLNDIHGVRVGTMLTILGASFIAFPVSAVTFNWILGADGNWIDASAWDQPAFPNGNDADATINSPTSETITLNDAIDLNHLTIGLENTLRLEDQADLRVFGQIVNHGQITQGGSTLAAAVKLEGNTTVSGSGTWTLNGTNANLSQISGKLINVLTNGPDHTFDGAGQIGMNLLGIHNLGTITANRPEGLTLQPSGVSVDGNGATVWNQGVLQAVDGGVLEFKRGISQTELVTYRNDTEIRADGMNAQVIIREGVEILGGTFASSDGGSILVAPIEPYSRFITPTLTNVVNRADLRTAEESNMDISGTFTNEATVNQFGLTRFTEDVTVNGGGTWIMNGINLNDVSFAGARETLTNGPSHTIEGTGTIGGNSGHLLNLGTIQATAAQRLSISPGPRGDVDGNGADVWNQGIIRAIDGGTMLLRSADLQRAFRNDGIIEAIGPDSLVRIIQVDLTGGHLISSEGGQVLASRTVITDITNQSILVLGNDNILRGTIVNQNTILSNTGEVLMGSDLTINGDGQMTLAGTRFEPTDAAFTLTNGTNHTLNGRGDLGGNLMGVVNFGVISGPQLEIDPGEVDLDGNGADFWNRGVLRADSTGGLTLIDGVFRNDGIMEANGPGRIRLEAGVTILGGTLTTTNGGAIEILENTVTLQNVVNSGDVIVDFGIDPVLTGTFRNDGTFLQQGSSSNLGEVMIAGNIVIDGDGTWIMNDIASGSRIRGLNGNEVLTNSESHTIRGSGAIGGSALGLINRGTILSGNRDLLLNPSPNVFLDGEANAQNFGLIRAVGERGIQIDHGIFANEMGGTFDIQVESELKILGEGRLIHKDGANFLQAGSLTIESGGVFENRSSDFSPGAAIGTITNDGTFVNTPGATFVAEFAGEIGGTEHDQVMTNASGSVVIDGTLQILLVNDYLPEKELSLELFIALGGITGRFASVENVDIADDRGLAVTYTATQVLVTNSRMGDANIDGVVNLLDLDALGANWQANGQGWQGGDFNGDGVADLLDLDLLSSNWGFGAPNMGSFTAALAASSITIPEPASVVLLTVGGALALRRRR